MFPQCYATLRRSTAKVTGRVLLGATSAALAWLSQTQTASAIPSFAVQTGQPCAACHVGAFGPQLTQFGRDFKLYGYVSSDGKSHWPAVSAMVEGSFTHTKADQNPAPQYFNTNNNLSVDQVSLFYGGVIIPDLMGAFVQATYDGIGHTIHWDNTDIRLAKEASIAGKDLIWGITLNNNPSVQDLWNSTPGWRYPYVQANGTFLPVNPGPPSAVIDGGLAQLVGGAGLYGMWNDLLYAEFDVYKQMSTSVMPALGLSISGIDIYSGVIPYWRVALQHAFGNEKHNIQVGTYGLQASRYPGGDRSSGTTDVYTDTAFDINYQWYSNPKDVTANILSTHATYIHEDQNLRATSFAGGSNPKDSLNTMRADLSYSIAATYTPSVSYFRTTGSSDDLLYWNNVNPKPNSAGWMAELAYSPWGKPDSPFVWLNPHVTLQYTAYTEYNGSTAGASQNNTIFLNLWWAFGLPH